MGVGNGNGHSDTHCPHNCSRCRAIELGYDTRPLTPREFAQVHTLVEPSREGRVVWADDTVEAGLALDVAQVEYEEAAREYARSLDLIEKQRARASRMDDDEAFAALQRAATLESVTAADLETVQTKLGEARTRHNDLCRRDSELHRRKTLSEMYAAQEAERAAQAATAKHERRGALALLRRS